METNSWNHTILDLITKSKEENKNLSDVIQEQFNNQEQQEKVEELLDKVEDYNEMKDYINYNMQTKPQVKKHKINRNDLCPCGSGKKYKNCCLKTGQFENYINIE